MKRKINGRLRMVNEEDKKTENAINVIICVVAVLIIMGCIMARRDLKIVLTDLKLPQYVYNVVHVKDLYHENRRLKTCLAESSYFEKTAFPYKIDGKETLCFGTPDDYWRYIKFQELCIKQ